jgi:hypothetical protein
MSTTTAQQLTYFPTDTVDGERGDEGEINNCCTGRELMDCDV